MSKCIGNCAKCTLEVDKMACCMVQILRNVVEMKKMVYAKVTASTCDVFKGIELIESEETTETGLEAPGTEQGGDKVNGEQ